MTTTDREQREEIRRDADEVLGDGYYLPGEPEGGNPYIASHISLARHCLALLDALEQAEYWMDSEDDRNADAVEDAEVLNALEAAETRAAQLEARLAAVPALVEALAQARWTARGEIGTPLVAELPFEDYARILEALAAYQETTK